MEFRYVATNRKTGAKVNGTATAPSISDLVIKLKGDELLPLKVFELKPAIQSSLLAGIGFWRSPVTGKELAIFTRQLAATLSAGLLLTESLETIADDLENVKFSKIIISIKEDIQSGSDFSMSLAKYPQIFPATYTAIVKSGEATGSLHTTMSNLAQYLEYSERLKEKVKSAVRYPSFVLGFALLVVTVIVFFLIPKFEGMFDNAGAELPMLTKIVVGFSQAAVRNAPIIVLGCVAALIGFVYAMRFRGFKFRIHQLILKIPIVGKDIIHKALVSRFCRTLGFLFAGGIGLSKALEITAQVVNHLPMSEAINQIRQRVIAGSSISDEIKKQPLFPKLTSKMVSVGERSGKVHEMLRRTSEYYDDELDATLQNLTSMIEPFLIVFIGGIVLVVVLALYLPIFNMSQAIR